MGRFANKTAKRNVDAAERDAKALQMRIECYSLEQIAKKLGYSGASEVCNIIQKRLRERIGRPAEELRQMEIERAETAERTAQRFVKKYEKQDKLRPADAAALLARAQAAQERRAKLQGLDAPVRIEQSGYIGGGHGGIQQLIQIIQQSGQELPAAAQEFLASNPASALPAGDTSKPGPDGTPVSAPEQTDISPVDTNPNNLLDSGGEK